MPDWHEEGLKLRLIRLIEMRFLSVDFLLRLEPLPLRSLFLPGAFLSLKLASPRSNSFLGTLLFSELLFPQRVASFKVLSSEHFFDGNNPIALKRRREEAHEVSLEE
jgi:hypothetical protein